MDNRQIRREEEKEKEKEIEIEEGTVCSCVCGCSRHHFHGTSREQAKVISQEREGERVKKTNGIIDK